MSEEMKETMQAEETSQAQAEEAAGTETTETMADYEEHFDDANPWNRVAEYMEKKTVLPVKVEGVVNGGVIAMVEGLRGFVPASKLSLSYIEDLETYLLKDIEVQVIDVDQANNRLVLSAREILKEKERKAREEQIANLKIGTVLEGTVETLQNYGAFVKLENGLSGLVHVSQISQKRVKVPSDVLNVGDKVTVKVIGIKDGKVIQGDALESLASLEGSFRLVFVDPPYKERGLYEKACRLLLSRGLLEDGGRILLEYEGDFPVPGISPLREKRHGRTSFAIIGRI